MPGYSEEGRQAVVTKFCLLKLVPARDRGAGGDLAPKITDQAGATFVEAG